jgi:hypothetical protein
MTSNPSVKADSANSRAASSLLRQARVSHTAPLESW